MKYQHEVTEADGNALGVFDTREEAIVFACKHFEPFCSDALQFGAPFEHQGGTGKALYATPEEPALGYLYTMPADEEES